MSSAFNASSFPHAAIAAFPTSVQTMAKGAAAALAALVDDNYLKTGVVAAVLLGKPLLIPYRISFAGLNEAWPPLQGPFSPAIQCLCSRSTDGHVRHAALRSVLCINESWAVPFVVLLAGEYVVEIVVDMVASLPTLERNIYADFVRENRHLMRQLRAKATSYWDCYYRGSYPDRRTYPGLVFLHELEAWAS